MYCLVIYDIVKDRIRNKVADACKDYGLQRIQYSAFLGDLTRNQRETLFKRLRRIIGDHTGNLRMYPLCEKDSAGRLEYVVVEDADD